jgi:hypothetical protein
MIEFAIGAACAVIIGLWLWVVVDADRRKR